MNNKSGDTQYMELITTLRESLKALAKKIEPKVHEYGFLKRLGMETAATLHFDRVSKF